MGFLSRVFGAKKVEGLIGFHGLTDWWLSAFSESERRYINERYMPMGCGPDTLTRGQVTYSSRPTTEFLNGLSTWFRSKKDESIANRIHRKIEELGTQQPLEGPGYYQGRHYTTYVSDVKDLKRSGRLDDAHNLLMGLIEAVEAEAEAEGRSKVAPWYYEELAKLYRRRKEFAKEVEILQRFATRLGEPDSRNSNLYVGGHRDILQRLDRARYLLNDVAAQEHG